MKLSEFHEYHQQMLRERESQPAVPDIRDAPLSHIEFYTMDDEGEVVPPGAEIFINLANSRAEAVKQAVGAEAKIDALAYMLSLLMVALKAMD